MSGISGNDVAFYTRSGELLESFAISRALFCISCSGNTNNQGKNYADMQLAENIQCAVA